MKLYNSDINKVVASYDTVVYDVITQHVKSGVDLVILENSKDYREITYLSAFINCHPYVEKSGYAGLLIVEVPIMDSLVPVVFSDAFAELNKGQYDHNAKAIQRYGNGSDV